MDERTKKNLEGVDSKLVEVVKLAYENSRISFIVIEGVRTLERQKQLLKEKKTTTLNSKHLKGRAVDVVPVVDGKISWEPKYFRPIAEAMKASAAILDIPIQWGGDWKSFVDMPHFELKD